MKGSGDPTDPRIIDEFDGGFGWIAYPDEQMQRASHALLDDGDVWIVDPVDAEGIDEEIASLGEVRGIVVGLDRHKRDAATFAERHDVPVFVPSWMAGSVENLPVPVETFDGRLPDSSYRSIRLVDNVFWKEVALYDREGGTLLVPEAVGTSAYMLAGDERLGVHPALRAIPPRKQLGSLSPERILVGHGEGIMEDATAALADALRGSRRRMPRLYAKTARQFLPV